ncbi:hypothetical protein HDV05_003884 [Chytridiales sp. JEL 0842]|nr:hypothetical protein HDV05_003884 [Chytridiales sp. JEL 0842]
MPQSTTTLLGSSTPKTPTNYFPYFSTTFTILVIGAYNYSPLHFDTYLSVPVIIGCVTLLGIPHGALDHTVFYQMYAECLQEPSNNSLREAKGKRVGERRDSARDVGDREEHQEEQIDEKEPLLTKPKGETSTADTLVDSVIKKLVFYFNYLAIMTVWGFMWVIAPIACFWTFLAVSAFHFGQGDLSYLAHTAKVPPALLYFSRGVLLLGSLVTSQPQITNPIIAVMTRIPLSALETLVTFQFLAIAQHFVLLGFHMVSAALEADHQESKSSSKSHGDVALQWGWELLKAILMTILFIYIDPLVAFAVYFGSWHALGSTIDEIRYLKQSQDGPFAVQNREIHEPSTTAASTTCKVNAGSVVTLSDVAKFLYRATPYTTVALLSMTVFYFLTTNPTSSLPKDFIHGTKLWSIFVISISILTGPHMWIMAMLHGKLQALGWKIAFGCSVKDGVDIPETEDEKTRTKTMLDPLKAGVWGGWITKRAFGSVNGKMTVTQRVLKLVDAVLL